MRCGVGTTSAHAENTVGWCTIQPRNWNYLRARGEYRVGLSPGLRFWELPPRTRRIPCGAIARATVLGTTSAHAENTPGDGGFCGFWGELPPRTRRIPGSQGKENRDAGTTSAHAENTFASWLALAASRNYLRARGEYIWPPVRAKDLPELPPRTRRIPDLKDEKVDTVGTTSAHAENTGSRRAAPERRGNYLRARGEYGADGLIVDGGMELPPRTRRIRTFTNDKELRQGTTSAHAENTPLSINCGHFMWNYLRARGEYSRQWRPPYR